MTQDNSKMMHTQSSAMFSPDAARFELLWQDAQENMDAVRPRPEEQDARIAQWKRQEYHNWLRWRICRKGFDWSKPGVLALLTIGFAALVLYGMRTGNWFVTAGGIVGWFTFVNLSFFTYFGLTLPGPPLAFPEPLKPWRKYRAEMGVFPAGYERRKLARVWLRVIASDGGPAHRFELAMERLPADLARLLEAQTTWRMQRGDAPLTHAVIETHAAAPHVKVLGWKWQPSELTGFNRNRA